MTPERATKLAYDLPGAAEAVTASVDHLRREIRAGRLAAKRMGRSYRVTADALRQWLEQLPDA